MQKHITNKKFLKAMAEAGLEKVLLVKDDGYFYIASDDEATALEIVGKYENAIYLNSFNQQPVEAWINDIKAILAKD